MCNAAHASVPSWSVIVTVGGTLTKRGRITYSDGPPSFSGGHWLTATMAGPAHPSMKHEKSSKLAYSPRVSTWKSRRCSEVMLVDMVAVPSCWVVRERRGGLARASAPRPAAPGLDPLLAQRRPAVRTRSPGRSMSAPGRGLSLCGEHGSRAGR